MRPRQSHQPIPVAGSCQSAPLGSVKPKGGSLEADHEHLHTTRRCLGGGELTDQHFAAQLDAVVRNPDAYPVYGQADAFFALTYPTAGLKEMLRRVFGRLSGTSDGESGVVRAETSFGGGKTHSLIAVHHLAAGSKPGNVAEFIDPALVPGGCRSVALVGDALDPVNGTAAPCGARAVTLWGTLAAQLGDDAWQAMHRSDETRTPPGRETLTDVIGTAPTVVMIDEIAAYLRTCAQSGDEDVRRMARQIPAFLKTLFEHAMSTANLVVVITLATAQDAFSEVTISRARSASPSAAALVTQWAMCSSRSPIATFCSAPFTAAICCSTSMQ